MTDPRTPDPDRPWPNMPPPSGRPGDDDQPTQPWPQPQPRPTPFRMSAPKQASPSAPTGAVLAVHSGLGALRSSRRPVTPPTWPVLAA